MTRLIHAELRKLSTTPLFHLGIVLVALSAGLAAVMGLSNAGSGTNPPLGPDSLGDAVSGLPISVVSVVVLVLANLGLAGEFQHKTITHTFLITPRRSTVVGAKLVTYALVGAAFAALAVVVTLLIVMPWLAAEDVAVPIADAAVAGEMAGIVISTGIYGILGVGLGALVRNQTAAVAVALVWVMGIEGLLMSVLQTLEPGLGDAVGQWLPGGAAAALSGATRPESLAAWTGGLLFAAYGFASAILGARLVMNGDIT